MKEIKYQIKYINKLADTAKELITDEYRDSGTIVFKAPTGSGKTYIVAALLNELALDLGEFGAKVTVITGFPSRRISTEIKNYYLNHPIPWK